MVETIFLIPLIIFLVSAAFWFARILLTRQQLATAARYGTDMILYTRLNENQIRREIRNYLCDWNIEGRRLDALGLPDENINIRIEDFSLPDFTGIKDFLNPEKFNKVLNAAQELVSPEKHTSLVQIRYEVKSPGILASWKKSVTVIGAAEVLAGTGCRNGIHKRNK
jgi:hypothetical protein